jgi:LacI family transcriptional regulator
MATMRDVAKRAGVSTATVSHLINGTRYVSPELAQRIVVAMRELNYRPDAVARSLRRRETLTIGLIVPDTEIPFYAAVVYAIETNAFERGYNVILCNSGWSLTREIQYLENLIARRIDGLVCISLNLTAEQIAPVVERGIPVVMFERQMPGIALDAVVTDNYKGAYKAVTHLLELGHRRIACISGLSGPAASDLSARRLAAYRQALDDWGIPFDPALVQPGNYRAESGRAGALALLELRNPPTAIFAFNDMMALGALQILHDRGLQVPGDVSVVGFDGIHLTEISSPALTTVVQPIAEMGKIAIEMLLARIRGEDPTEARCVVVEPKLVVRASTIGATTNLTDRRPAASTLRDLTSSD